MLTWPAGVNISDGATTGAGNGSIEAIATMGAINPIQVVGHGTFRVVGPCFRLTLSDVDQRDNRLGLSVCCRLVLDRPGHCSSRVWPRSRDTP